MSEQTELEEKRRLMESALQSFAFLEERGYKLVKRWGPTGASFKDGFRLVYASSSVQITVEYFDMEFFVWLQRGGVMTDFLFLDKHLNAGASGYHGTMFLQQKLEPVIRNTARIISNQFLSVINGEDGVWSQIKRLTDAPVVKKGLP